MKINIITQNITDIAGLKQGLTNAQNLLSKIGIYIFFDYSTTDKKFTSIPLNTDVVKNGYEVNPSDIISVMQPNYDITCLIYDWNAITPRPTNPCTNYRSGDVPMQIPLQFYTDTTVTPNKTYIDVLTQFFLHEFSHYIADIKGVKDLTHFQYMDLTYSNKPPIDYYLYLIKQTMQPTQSVIITRKYNATETYGDLIAGNGNTTFTCKTLERPNLGNKPNVSCIPEGTYQVVWTFHLGTFGWRYQLQNVPGRSGILMHSGNYFTDSLGCILFGSAYQDINKDGVLDIINSRATEQAFEAFMQKKPFTLTIKS